MTDNPDAFPNSANDSAEPTHGARFSIVKLLLGLAVGAVLLALMLPAVDRGARHAARRTQCKNNLKQIGLALANYRDANGAFPPAYTVDSDGKPLHSWRTLILPHLDQQSLYKTIDLSKPWNHPTNVEASKATIPGFACPSTKAQPGHTTYLAVVTPNSCLRPAEPRFWSEITDGTSNTWVVIETPPDHAVHWMAPMDADEEFMLKFDDKTKFAHPGGTHVLLADGSVRFASANLPAAVRLALISISGKETPPEF